MPSPSRSEARREAGFSLVEVLCALAIAALAMVALLKGLGTSQLGAGRMESHIGARVILESILEDELMAADTAPAHREGQSGPYRWSLDITPAAVNAGGELPRPYRLYSLDARVRWGASGELAAQTLKLAK